jgi:pyruvate/2-oxoglutarate dehydrogenase complex dihydrolipoamide acyltransferase (E2) component
MGVSEILASVDREIALLKQVRALLSGTGATAPKKKAGRPKKTMAAAAPATQKPAAKRRKKRTLSPEGRKRIAEAVRRRWEVQRKAAASK